MTSSVSASSAARVRPSVWRVLLPIGLGTALSLMGDTALYAVLPTHVAEAGVTLASVGILLSANRWIRLLLNGPAGLLYDRWPRRWFFIPALFIGTLSTALYGWTTGFWPLLAGRLLWGVAWSGIWVGGNTIILDVTTPEDRGRWTGLYQLSFFLGGALGFPVSGLLTDWLGFHPALQVAAVVTGVGALLALLLLPETHGRHTVEPAVEPLAAETASPPAAPRVPPPPAKAVDGTALAAATLLYGANRFVVAGVISASLGLLIEAGWGEVRLGSGVVGIATLTGALLGTNTLISMFAAPLAGHWSDRLRSRWQVVALGLVPGVVGLALLSTIHPWAIIPGVLLVAVAGGSNQSLATALLGDATLGHRRGRAMGWMHTFGDLSSAAAPLLVYAVLPWLGLTRIYLVCAGLLLALLLWAARRAAGPRVA
jgi:MFS family permease